MRLLPPYHRQLLLLVLLLAGRGFAAQAQRPTAVAKDVTVQLAPNGTATLAATSVNNGSTGASALTYTIQKIVYGQVGENGTLTLTTPSGASFTAIRYASYGTSTGTTGNYVLGPCHAATSTSVVSTAFVGKATASLAATNGVFGDPCVGTVKNLAVQAAYSADAATQPYTCADVAGPNYVLLTATDGSGNTATATAKVTVLASPTATFTSLSPATGPQGTLLTATGTNLSGATRITVNGAEAAILSASATALTFRVPAAPQGAGLVVVALPCSQSLSKDFTVTATPLPVQLVAFTAQAQGSTVALAWRTASEVNSARFEVERSLDGVAFGQVGSVAAAGTSLAPRSYELLDAHLPAGARQLYYRLRQVDLDGTAAYSPVQVVAVAAGRLSLYPNPARGTATLSGAAAGAVVQVYSTVGTLVLTAPADADGTAALALPAGVYAVRAGSAVTRLVVE